MVVIRSARADDIDDFKEVVKSSITVLCKDYYSEEQIEGLLKQYPGPELYRRWLNERVLIVAEMDEKIIGFAQFDPARSGIEAVHVLPEYTYLGIGRNLVREIEKIAREKGVKKLVLDSSINADEFYSKCGYMKKGIGKVKCNNGVELDTISYEKELQVNSAINSQSSAAGTPEDGAH